MLMGMSVMHVVGGALVYPSVAGGMDVGIGYRLGRSLLVARVGA